MTDNVSESDILEVDKSTLLNHLFQIISITAIFNFFFYAIILTAPLIVYGVSIAGVSVRLSRILVISIIPVLFLKIWAKPSLIYRDKFFIFGIIPYLIYTTISIIWAPNIEDGFAFKRLNGLYEVILVYIIFIVADLNAKRFKKFVTYYVISAILPLGFSIWQFVNNILQFSVAELPFQNLLIAGKYEDLSGRWGEVAMGFSRISATFAEPTIFGSYMCSVLLLSLLVECKKKSSLITLKIFQILVFLGMILSLSKLAILTFIFGIIVILRKQIMHLMPFFIGLLLFIAISYLLLSYYNLDFITKRFLTDSGHIELIKETIAQFENINLITGDGIGSIPRLTTNKFLLSRIYEGGVIGIIFALYVSALPFMILYQKVYNYESNKIKNICVGVMFAVIFGLHLYDYFIYLFTWIVIGSTVSFYNNSRKIITA